MALELVSEYVYFPVFRLSIRQGKSLYANMFLKLQRTCRMCSLSHGLGVVSFTCVLSDWKLWKGSAQVTFVMLRRFIFCLFKIFSNRLP